MKRVQTIVLMTAPLALMACQGEAPIAPPAGGKNETEEVVNTPDANAPDSAENNAEAAETDPSTLNAAPSSGTAKSESNPPAPERSPAGSKLQRAD